MSKIEELRTLRERGQGGIRPDKKRAKAEAALKKAERKAKKGKSRG